MRYASLYTKSPKSTHKLSAFILQQVLTNFHYTNNINYTYTFYEYVCFWSQPHTPTQTQSKRPRLRPPPTDPLLPHHADLMKYTKFIFRTGCVCYTSRGQFFYKPSSLLERAYLYNSYYWETLHQKSGRTKRKVVFLNSFNFLFDEFITQN